MSIDPRTKIVDNLGWQPCLPPLLLGRLMDRICEGRKPTLLTVIRVELATLRRRLGL